MLNQIKSFLRFISLLRVEVFMYFTATSLYIRNTPLDLLIQDKLCRNKYNLSADFCFNLSKIAKNDSDYHYVSDILAEAVQYNMWQNIIQYAPGIIWALFLGAWIDKYNNGRKAVFIIGSTTQCLEAIINWSNSYYFDSDVKWVLLSFIPYILTGSMTWSTAYSYVAATTPPHLISFRMMVLETIVALAHMSGVLMYGRLINESPVWSNGQIHNTALIFFISALMAFIAFVWNIFLVNQQKDKQNFDKFFAKTEDSDERNEIDDKYHKIRNRRHALRMLFDFKNVKEVFTTSFKKRPNSGRTKIWLIIAGIFTYLFVLIFVPTFEFQFIEKTYGWDAQEFSFWQSMGLIANMIFVLTFTPLLTQVFKVNDMVLALIGFTGLMLRMIVLATVLNPIGYYISVAFSCTTWMADVGFRSQLSRSVDDSELGKIFTLLTIVDGIVPPVASTISAHVFKATIDTYAGLSYVLAAVVCVFALIIILVIIRLNKKTANQELPDIIQDNITN